MLTKISKFLLNWQKFAKSGHTARDMNKLEFRRIPILWKVALSSLPSSHEMGNHKILYFISFSSKSWQRVFQVATSSQIFEEKNWIWNICNGTKLFRSLKFIKRTTKISVQAFSPELQQPDRDSSCGKVASETILWIKPWAAPMKVVFEACIRLHGWSSTPH